MIIYCPIIDEGPRYLLVRGWRCCMTQVTEEDALQLLYLVNLRRIWPPSHGITAVILGAMKVSAKCADFRSFAFVYNFLDLVNAPALQLFGKRWYLIVSFYITNDKSITAYCQCNNLRKHQFETREILRNRDHSAAALSIAIFLSTPRFGWLLQKVSCPFLSTFSAYISHCPSLRHVHLTNNTSSQYPPVLQISYRRMSAMTSVRPVTNEY